MNREFTVLLGQTPVNIYMQNGFFEFDNITTAVHKHLYVEIHLMLEGGAIYKVGNDRISVMQGELLLIPADKLHSVLLIEKCTKRIAFQLEPFYCEKLQKQVVSEYILTQLCKEIKEYETSGKSGRLKLLISLLCLQFGYTCQDEPVIPIRDRAFIIYEFFYKNYNTNVRLEDLAVELMMSPKQTERMVRKYTGRNFRQQLSYKRMEAAARLIADGELSMLQISEQVGYRSYSGFWKAYNNYKNDNSVN